MNPAERIVESAQRLAYAVDTFGARDLEDIAILTDEELDAYIEAQVALRAVAGQRERAAYLERRRRAAASLKPGDRFLATSFGKLHITREPGDGKGTTVVAACGQTFQIYGLSTFGSTGLCRGCERAAL